MAHHQPESTVADTMQAIVQKTFGGPETLYFAEVPTPKPGPHDLVVQVKAAAINPVDMKVRGGGPAGQPVPNAPRILGWDGAGVVVSMGNEVNGFRPGDEVFFAGDMTRAGAYAEYLAIDARIVAHKPHNLRFEEAAAVPLTALTAWEAFFEQMRMSLTAPRNEKGEVPVVLIVGGGGGVGSIAIQIAKKVGGYHVVATASRPESTTYCLEMGADTVIDHHEELAPQLRALGLPGADYILNTALLSNFPHLVACLNPLGHICSIVGGDAARSLDVTPLFPLRGTLTFELMFTRPRLGLELAMQGQILRRVAEQLDAGTLVTTAQTMLPWDQVQEAHRAIETGHTTGKIVLQIA